MTDRSLDRADGPAVVAIGGGHGLAATLRAARTYAGSVTAVVSVADDGGSSGRLRASMPGMPAPGDVRRCLSALAADDSALGAALEHRFSAGDLEGHALGNLLITGLADRSGDFVAAVDEVAALVGAVGRVLPATREPITLHADVAGQEPAVGQVEVQRTRNITRVGMVPADPSVPPDVVAAVARADQVVIGPGSLFTSVLAATVVPGVAEALAATSARCVYVCNLRPQVPETEGFGVADHVRALLDHGVRVDDVLSHGDRLDGEIAGLGVRHTVAVLTEGTSSVHDTKRLGQALATLV